MEAGQDGSIEIFFQKLSKNDMGRGKKRVKDEAFCWATRMLRSVSTIRFLYLLCVLRVTRR